MTEAWHRRRELFTVCTSGSLGKIARKLKTSSIEPALGARQHLLDLTAEQTGQLWAAHRCDELAVEKRPAQGGWPGTLGEARARVGRAIASVLRERKLLALTHAEHGRATHLAYEAARRAWLQVTRQLGPRSTRDDE